MPKNILGSGWKFPVSLNEKDGVTVSRHEEKIKESIFIILDTAKGERVMRPDFGCDIHDYVFSVVNATTLTQIETAVKEALILWEPRIEVLGIQSSMEKLNRGILNIGIAYKVRYTNTAFNLVYPFYLKSEGE